MTGQDVLTIGDVAEATGLAVTAIRYYEEKNLITVAYREHGHRRFSSSVVGRLNFIKAAQRFGFSLGEIKQIFKEDPGTWKDLVKNKVTELKVQQEETFSMITVLEEIQSCGCRAVADCPRIVKAAQKNLNRKGFSEMELTP